MRQLRRGKLRRRPFAFVPPDVDDDTLQAIVVKAVHRSIERVRLAVPMPSVAGWRHGAAALRRDDVSGIPGSQWVEVSERFARAEQELPPRANPLKWKCASEAFYLVDTWSEKPPKASEGGPYFVISKLLFQACTGKSARV